MFVCVFVMTHQGGPHNHTIAGLAVCLKLANSESFKEYQRQVSVLSCCYVSMAAMGGPRNCREFFLLNLFSNRQIRQIVGSVG